MKIDEIMETYKGFPDDEYKLIKKYVTKFKDFYPVYGPCNSEIINYCIDHELKIDDLSRNDEIYKKYFDDKFF